ncbi:MAG: type I-C CRISPR-associated protein Cas8c/Csd1 [Deltaproteobacteria bacterium]|nr:type I-C CRISPR-associated protein Cas8c/Csd1 [Deltaproteobacteria bacterium]
MLRELYEAADRFAKKEDWLPPFYKKKNPKWVIEIRNGKAKVTGPYKKREFRAILAPDRQRSSKAAKKKPFLGMDKAAFVLETPPDSPFWVLMKDAAEKTGDSELKSIVEFACGEGFNRFVEVLKGNADDHDLVGFRIEGCGQFPFEKRSFQAFWLEYLTDELALIYEGRCSITGDQRKLVKTIPQEIVVMGQKCQISSFNKSAFTSFGKQQTANASISVVAIAKAIQSLQYLANHPRHHAILARGDTKSGTDPLRNYFAIFWLQREEIGEIDGEEFNLEDILALPLKEHLPTGDEEKDEQGNDRFDPPVDLQELDELLRSPWTGKEVNDELPENVFQLAVLSANKGRLVMRDWLSVSISRLQQNLIRFYDAMAIINPWGGSNRVFPIPALVRALRSEPKADTSAPKEGGLSRKRRNVDSRHSELVRSLVRSAYLGCHPDPSILTGAVQRFRNPKTLSSDAEIHVLAGVIKLILTYSRKEAEAMQTLDHARNARAYLCGRILAILEEAQRRAANQPLNTTLVDRAYGAASMSPKSMLPALIRTLEMGHLPKIRKKWKAGYDELRESLENICKQLDETGGYPVTLSLQDQAEFALGFYCQRAEFRKPKQVQNDAKKYEITL